jgi:hypothetical protein
MTVVMRYLDGKLVEHSIDGVFQNGLTGAGLPVAPRPKDLSLARKARNLAAAGARVAKATATGQKVLVSAEEKERRLAICNACEHLKNGSCELCGCVASWKTKLATESCPVAKW